MLIRFSFSFCPKGEGGVLGGVSTYLCVKHACMGQTRGVQGYAPPGNFDFGAFIKRYLVESGTVFTQTLFTIYSFIYQDLNWFRCKIEFSAYIRGGKPITRRGKCPPLPQTLLITLAAPISLLCPTLSGWWWVGIMPAAYIPLGRPFDLCGEFLLYICLFL